MAPPIYVGCAGWTLPRATQPGFPAEGTHLARYAARFAAADPAVKPAARAPRPSGP